MTVKQPLPLPQGVSDLAVGGAAPGAARMAKMAASPPPTADAEIREEAAADKTAGRAGQATVAARVALLLDSVQAPGLEEAAVKIVLESRLEHIGPCLAALPEPLPHRFSVLITVDGAGRVVSVDPIPKNADLQPATCLAASLQGLRVPVPAGSRQHSLVATFTVKR